MNSAHDVGGMHGFGPVDPERDEPVFHEPWEATVFAMSMAASCHGVGNQDEGRHAIEQMGNAAYLSTSYYEHWLAGLERTLDRHGVVSREELDARVEAVLRTPERFAAPPVAGDDELARRLVEAVRAQESFERDSGPAPRFAVGDRVRTRNVHPAGHTRLPRYARGKLGEVVAHHGNHVFPDANAHGGGEDPQPLYGVRFSAPELWGDGASPGDWLHLDLWERYLESP